MGHRLRVHQPRTLPRAHRRRRRRGRCLDKSGTSPSSSFPWSLFPCSSFSRTATSVRRKPEDISSRVSPVAWEAPKETREIERGSSWRRSTGTVCPRTGLVGGGVDELAFR
ncbi:hypothetical protein WN55_06948 [Dufourea novaeangliae]|uniref:Uncharacterized protein n=1 Tax=Dufourea novaeangliae TaxID=178035 RepID=A0A154PRW8_DUFNO|nr:hypothetical protein WN55_06948 [Dufourea novaeangliae]